MKAFFIAVGLIAITLMILPSSAMALRVVHAQVILDSLDDYNHCQGYDDTGDMCQDALKRWVKAHPGDAFEAGKLTRKIMNSWAAVPFFAQAFSQNAGDCKDEDVKLSVVSALELPEGDGNGAIEQAKKIGFGLCFNEMKDAIIDATGDSQYALKNACPGLIAKGAVKGLRLQECQAVQ